MNNNTDSNSEIVTEEDNTDVAIVVEDNSNNNNVDVIVEDTDNDGSPEIVTEDEEDIDNSETTREAENEDSNAETETGNNSETDLGNAFETNNGNTSEIDNGNAAGTATAYQSARAIRFILGSTRGQLGYLYTSLGFLAVGIAGIGPNTLAFGAGQFRPGSRGVKSYFFWNYVTFAVAGIITLTFIVYLQSRNWAVGLAVPIIFMFISIVLFFSGTKFYVRDKPRGSPLTSYARVLVAAIHKRNLEHPQPASLFNFVHARSTTTSLQHTDQFRLLDKAAIVSNPTEINSDGSAANPWRLCSVHQVEEVKCWFQMMPIWVSFIIFNLSLSVQGTGTFLQSLQLNKHLGDSGFEIPATSFGVFSLLTVTIIVPLYDKFLVPVIERKTGRPGGLSLLQRMGSGIICAIFSLLVSGYVEKVRRTEVLGQPAYSRNSHMSAFILVPQLILFGFVEALGSIAQSNFLYEQMPQNAKSMAQAMNAAGGAILHYFLGFLLLPQLKGSWLPNDLNHGKLDFIYYTIAAVQAANFVYFVICSRRYRYIRV